MPFAVTLCRRRLLFWLILAVASGRGLVAGAGAQPVVPSQRATGHAPAKESAHHHPAREVRGAAHPLAKAPAPPVAQPAAPAEPAAVPAPVAVPPAPAAPDKGSVTGLPLPRFATLRSDEVNLRSGPGTRYPIDWVYQRRDLPVEIEREFEVWRLVEDFQGTKGWVHQATLTGRRGLVIVGGERTLRVSADPHSPAVARLMPGVIGRILKCAAGAPWCEVQIGDYRGWLARDDFWGSLPGEAIP